MRHLADLSRRARAALGVVFWALRLAASAALRRVSGATRAAAARTARLTRKVAAALARVTRAAAAWTARAARAAVGRTALAARAAAGWTARSTRALAARTALAARAAAGWTARSTRALAARTALAARAAAGWTARSTRALAARTALAARAAARWSARVVGVAASRTARATRAAAKLLAVWVGLAMIALQAALRGLARAVRRAGALARVAPRAATRAVRARPRLFIVAVSVLVGFFAAGVNSGTLSLLPPRLHASDLRVAAAKTHVMIDQPASQLSITRRTALPPDIASLVKRAELMGQVAVTRVVLDRIAERAGLEKGQLLGLSRLTADAPLAFTEPGSERRAADVRSTAAPYRIEVQSRPNTPVLDIYAQAHETAEAERIADATVVTLRDYLKQLATEQGVDPNSLPRLRQLGPARGGVIGGRTPFIVAVLTFVVAFGLVFGALAYVLGLHRRRSGAVAARPDAGGAWPRTTRVLPWMLAGFIAMLWLTPFHTIELTMSTPIDMTLDRLVLPFMGGLWLLALAAGARVAPRFRLTWIHVAVAAFVVFACLSVVLDARGLTRTLELDQSIKKLPLLITYVSLFVIVTSVIRRSEVDAFLTYTLGLGVVVALGLVFEYRFKHNYFFELPEQLLPGFFTMGQANNPSALDHMGRRLVHGPAEVPLEVVTMLSLALCVALVRLLNTSQRRTRIAYGVAACALMAAMFATFRKSGLLAPVSVVMALAYFRRSELLKLAPLGLIIIVVVSALSPGALGSTIRQFTRSDALSVPTVSDRSSDYDAVRPDVWSHLAFGRGWGSYNHVDYRILDSEILHRLIEMGVLGLIAYFMIPCAVLLSARATIAARDPRTAPAALVGAAAAVAFIAASTFYDVMSFPHATYIFLYVAGLAAIAIGRPDGQPEPEPAVEHRLARGPGARPPRAAHARARGPRSTTRG